MIKRIIFDMDGTLWHTERSYLFSYGKTCDKYGITDRFSDEVVLRHLGVKLEELVPSLFPSVGNDPEVGICAMRNSIEYLLAHPDECIYPGVCDLLNGLSEKYELYLVSNCPLPYAETFLKISGTARCFSGVLTVESGSKSDNLGKITSGAEGKCLFVGDSIEDYGSIRDHFGTTFCYAAYGYSDCRRYDCSIGSPADLPSVLSDLEIKERQLAGKEYKTISCGENRLTYIKNMSGRDYFGYVNYADGDFSKVVEELIREAPGGVIGPINGNTFYPYRFSADNFDWKLYPDCESGEKTVPCFLEKGFSVAMEYVSVLSSVNVGRREMARSAELPEEYSVCFFTGKEAYSHVGEVYRVAVDSFSDAFLYEKISEDDFCDIYLSGLRRVVPDLVLIFKNGAPIAFSFCYEDPEKRFYVCKTMAVVREERNSSVIMTLLDRSYRRMEELGYDSALEHFRNLSNIKESLFCGKYCIRRKKYVLLEYKK